MDKMNETFNSNKPLGHLKLIYEDEYLREIKKNTILDEFELPNDITRQQTIEFRSTSNEIVEINDKNNQPNPQPNQNELNYGLNYKIKSWIQNNIKIVDHSEISSKVIFKRIKTDLKLNLIDRTIRTKIGKILKSLFSPEFSVKTKVDKKTKQRYTIYQHLSFK